MKTMKQKLDDEKSLELFKQNIDQIISEIEEDPDKIDEMDLSEEQISAIRQHINPYVNTITGSNKITCLSHTNMTKDYLTKLLTTTMIGFLYRMCDEYEILDEELNQEINDDDFMDEVPNPDLNDEVLVNTKKENIYRDVKLNYIKEHNLAPTKEVDGNIVFIDEVKNVLENTQLSEDDELNISTESNNQFAEFFKPRYVLNQVKRAEYVDNLIKHQSQEEQVIIKRFLNKLFEYNPDLHTQSSYHENIKDPERRSLKPVSREEKDKTKHMTLEQLLHTKTPPNDTFLRLNYYYDVNHEEMRDVVRDIYCCKPDIDVVINVYEQFDSIEEAEHYVKKHQDEVKTDILTLTNNSWNFIGPFKKNRERINFYNKNTAILEAIFKQQEEDSKLGAELMKDRVRKKKVRNTKYMGKDAPEFKKFIKENPSGASSLGAIKITNEDEEKVEITEEYEIAETGAKIDEDGIPEDSVKIGVTSINAKTGKVKSSEIYTKAKAPENMGGI